MHMLVSHVDPFAHPPPCTLRCLADGGPSVAFSLPGRGRSASATQLPQSPGGSPRHSPRQHQHQQLPGGSRSTSPMCAASHGRSTSPSKPHRHSIAGSATSSCMTSMAVPSYMEPLRKGARTGSAASRRASRWNATPPPEPVQVLTPGVNPDGFYDVWHVSVTVHVRAYMCMFSHMTQARSLMCGM